MDIASTNGQTDGETAHEPVFKKTKVGWIPEDWRVVKVGAILEESNLGGNYSSDEMNEGVPLIKMGNVKRGRIRLDELKYIEDEANVEGSDLLTEGDLLLNTRNTPELVGKVALWRGELPKAAFDSNLMRMRFDDAHVYSSAFMNSAFNAHYVIKQLWSYAQGTTSVAAIYKRDVLKVRIALPPLAEQRRIANILSEWDRAIDQIDELIAAKERRKTALMQQLLKGKTRVPGYGEDEWVKVKIGDLLKRVKRYVDWDDDAQYDLVSVKRGSEGLYHRKSIYGREKKTKKLHTLKEGDFVISRMQVVHGATAYVTPEFEGMHVSNSYIILRPREEANIDTEFFAWLAKMPYMYHLAYLASHGVHIEKMTFKPKFYFKSEVKIPPTVEEQQEIVSILKTCEQEIETLRDERAALRRQKRGMMQKLLTGKIRVSTEPTSPQVEA